MRSKYRILIKLIFFLACSNVDGESNYLCEWAAGPARKTIIASTANEMFPKLVVEFFESKLNIAHGSEPTLEGLDDTIYLTRQVKKWATENKVSFGPKAIIVRDIGFEKFILKRQAAPIIQRRATVAAGNEKAKNKNIPFGARGRKRTTISIAYVGIQANPDGRKLGGPRTYARAQSLSLPSGSSAIQTPNQLANKTPSNPNGGKMAQPRTYARAQSTSLPSGSTTIQTPNPLTNITTSPNPNATADTTLELDTFDSPFMGRLNYDSDSE